MQFIRAAVVLTLLNLREMLVALDQFLNVVICALSQRKAAADSARMLADVLGRADARAAVLAEYADSARIAGELCVRQYDSLTAK